MGEGFTLRMKNRYLPTIREFRCFVRFIGFSRLIVVALSFVLVISGLLAYEFFQPDFYKRSKSSKITPFALIIGPPAVIILFVRHVKDWASKNKDKLNDT